MQLAEVVITSRDVARLSGRLEKTARLADLLVANAAEEIETVVAFLSGGVRQGRIGTGIARLPRRLTSRRRDDRGAQCRRSRPRVPALAGLDRKGLGRRARAAALRTLFSRATRDEQEFLRRLLYGELRQGALEGVLLEAIARAADVPAAALRRAAMLAGDLGAGRPRRDDRAARRASTRSPFSSCGRCSQCLPIRSQPSTPRSTALDDASLEYKLDGARIQVHKAGDDVRVFSRTLRDVTDAAPEVVEVVRAVPARELILDGEVIALRPDGRPHPFQVTMRRFGRTREVARTRLDLPLTPFFFDCLYADGTPLLDAPLEQRTAVLHELAGSLAVPRLVRPTRDAARAFARGALDRGHEGVMAKSLTAPVRRRPPRRRLAEGQAGPDARPRRPGR